MFTLIRVVLLKYLTLHKGIQALQYVLLVFNLQLNIYQRLLSLTPMFTRILPDELCHQLASKSVSYKVLMFSVCETFYLVHEAIAELLNVHLFHDVDRVSVPVLEGVTKIFRVYVLLSTLLE